MAKDMTQAELRAKYLAWTTQPNRCAICHIPVWQLASYRYHAQLELAHIISRARAGKAGNVVGNVLMLCSSCHGAQHQTHYTHDDEQWPELDYGHLLRAKLELGELSLHLIASISGYTDRYILERSRISWPVKITSEWIRWE